MNTSQNEANQPNDVQFNRTLDWRLFLSNLGAHELSKARVYRKTLVKCYWWWSQLEGNWKRRKVTNDVASAVQASHGLAGERASGWVAPLLASPSFILFFTSSH